MNYFKGVCKGIIGNQVVFEVDDEDILAYFRNRIDEPLKIETKKWHDNRSLAQNALYWKCIMELSKVAKVKKDDMHLMMLRQTQIPETLEISKDHIEDFREIWRTFEVVGTETNEDGEEMAIINAYYGSHLMDVEEFSHLIDIVIQEMKDCDIDLPSREMRDYLDAFSN